MVQRRGGAGFALEPVERVPVPGEIGGQELERDLPAEAGVLGLIDGPRASASEQLEDTVMGDDPADHHTSRERRGGCSGRRRTTAPDSNSPGSYAAREAHADRRERRAAPVL